MQTTQHIHATYDDDDYADGQRSLAIYSHGVHVATIDVLASGWLDYRDELSQVEYNLLHIANDGQVINDKPTLA